MNFGHVFQGANPNISIAADDFIQMKRLLADLQQQNEQQRQQIEQQRQHGQQQQQQVTELLRRCGALENRLRWQIQARQESESQCLQADRRHQAQENEIVALRTQLREERLRAGAMCRAGGAVLNPASIPLRIVPVGDRRASEAGARHTGRNDSVNPSNPSSIPSEPSPGPVPPLSQYPSEIPEEDREAIRVRLLKDRGPNTPPASGPTAVHTPAPAASLQDVETASRAPSSGAQIFESSHNDVTRNEDSKPKLCQEGGPGAVHVDHGDIEDEIPQNEGGTSQLGFEGDAGAADDGGEETEDEIAQNEAGTSQLDEPRGAGAPDVDSEETDDDCIANMEISDDDDDECGAHNTTSTSTITLGYPGKHAPCDEASAIGPAGLAPSPPAAEDVVTFNDLAPVKSESSTVPCTTIGASPADPTTAGKLVVTSSAANEEETKEQPALPLPPGAVLTTPPVVKTEAFSSFTRAACEAPVVTSTCSTSSAPTSFSHQLFSSTLPETNHSTRSASDSADTVVPPESIHHREPWDVSNRGREDDKTFKQTPRDRLSHNTFCSSCKNFRTEQEPLAKCAACPRVLCRTCAGRKGEEVPRGVAADDVVFGPDRCVCHKRDSEFTKPPAGMNPHEHLLKQLKKHDLAHMFLDPVDVEVYPDYLAYVSRDLMIDLGTMTTKMEKRKQYQSSRGKVMFRRDLMRMWQNCWKYAGHTPKCPQDEAVGIVRCTLILEAMVKKFYDDYMEEEELVTDEGSWLADQVRRHNEKFELCARPGGGMQDELEPPVAAAECESDSDDSVELDHENRRIGATVSRKRKFVFKDDIEDEDDCDKHERYTKAAGKEGLARNICALAAIGEKLQISRDKT
eukprot:g15915.t1